MDSLLLAFSLLSAVSRKISLPGAGLSIKTKPVQCGQYSEMVCAPYGGDHWRAQKNYSCGIHKMVVGLGLSCRFRAFKKYCLLT